MRVRKALLVTAMKRTAVLALFALAIASVAFAQTTPPSKTVAMVNGETVTEAQLDRMYDELPAQMREQYDNSGGKGAFLENYLRKRLVIQEAIKSGFDRRPEVRQEMKVAADSALFDTYVRDVVASGIVSDAAMRDYYNQHQAEFATPERIHVRHIVITASNTGPHPRSKQAALDVIQRIAAELHGYNMDARAASPTAAAQMRLNAFAQAARRYSEDASATEGGDLGWVVRGQLVKPVDDAAFGMPIGVPSGVIERPFGYHLLFVEEKQPAGTEPFDQAKAKIRQILMTQHMGEIMQSVTKLTNELRAQSTVTVYPENIK